MERIIINNYAGLSDLEAMIAVIEVIKLGRISNDGKQYCYHSSFEANENRYHVEATVRERSDSFKIFKDK